MRLIDADEALRLFGKKYEETKKLIHNGETQLDSLAEGFTEAHHIIKYVLPTVDAVPVVRCKDCKYYKISELHPPYKFCFRLRHPTENRSVGYYFADDDFCSHGECREGKDEK